MGFTVHKPYTHTPLCRYKFSSPVHYGIPSYKYRNNTESSGKVPIKILSISCDKKPYHNITHDRSIEHSFMMEETDIIKMRSFCIQALCGTLVAFYRACNEIPTNPYEVKYLFATYLNQIHREVITGESGDDYVRKMLENAVRHHSINCICHVFFTVGVSVLDHLFITFPRLCDSYNGHAATCADELRTLLTDHFDRTLPSFREFVGHTCTGQSIEELKKEIADGVFTPFIEFGSAENEN